MSNFFALFGGSEKDKRYTFSLEKLHALYRRLQELKTTDLKDKENSREQIVETIRQITEALLWGEKNDSSFFDFFCEKNILAEFVDVLSFDCPRNVKVQLLQTLSILVGNIKTKTSLYYIFSNNHLNVLISKSLDWSDEEVLAYYITLLKSLSIRLNDETVKFFYNEQQDNFPLYTEAIRFFNHRDQMIRTTIRTLTLQIYKTQDPVMRKFVTRKADYYFTHLACYVRDLWIRLDAEASSHYPYRQKVDRLKELIDQIDDTNNYILDIFSVELAELTDALSERLLVYAIYPLLLGTLVRGDNPQVENPPADNPSNRESGNDSWNYPNAKVRRSSHTPKKHIILGRHIAMYLLRRVITAFRHAKTLICPLAKTLIEKRLSSAISSFCYAPATPVPRSYPSYNADNTLANHTMEPDKSKQTMHLPNSNEGFPIQNAFRAKILKSLDPGDKDPQDIEIFDVSGLIYALITKNSIPVKLLEDNALIPLADTRRPSIDSFGALSTTSNSSSSGDACFKEIMMPLCQAFQYYTKLRCCTLFVIQRTLLELVFVQPNLSSKSLTWLIEGTAIAMRRCANDFKKTYLEDNSDMVVEGFSEQWEAHKGPMIDICEVFGDPQSILPSAASESDVLPVPNTDPLDWIDPMPHDVSSYTAAQRHMRCFLLLRRFHRQFVSLSTREEVDPSVLLGPSLETSPFSSLSTPGDDDEYGITEGQNMELAKSNRIICGVIGPKGKNTRYLMRHDRMFILVAPDLSTPGWGIIRTICPVRVLKANIDRNDNRTLLISIMRPGNPPGESQLDPGTSGARLKYVLTLNFEDKDRCLCAYSQISTNRKQIREETKEKIVSFLDQSS